MQFKVYTKTLWSYENKILMRIHFILEVYVYRRIFTKSKFKLYDLFLWTGFFMLKVICHYWVVDYFNCYFNQIPEK